MSNIANTVYMAIVQHNTWKKHLKDAIQQGDDLDNYNSSPHDCEFGKWLDKNKDTLSTDENYTQVYEIHSEFHSSAGKVILLAESGDYKKACAAMEYGSDFDHHSQALVKAIIAWHDALSGK
ncbi:MAG: hypothetical protein GY862_12370 [Gammaproteobacteria bacterium]|nr:hypothetical protein [Gammaproteobacteria bacterium]